MNKSIKIKSLILIVSFIGFSFCCEPEEITKEVDDIEIIYDDSLQQYVQKPIKKTETGSEKMYNYFPLYDSEGNPLLDGEGKPRTHKIPIMKDIQEIKQELIYDSNGNIQYEDDLDTDGNQQIVYEYDTRFLNADGSLIATEAEYLTKKNAGENVYIACFVGCTYHCG